MPADNRSRRLPRLVAGLGLVTLGALLLLDNLGLIDAGPVLPWFWALAVLALGGSWLLQGRRCLLQGALATAIGALLLVRAGGYDVRFDVWNLFLPALLLVFGTRLVRRALGAARAPDPEGIEGGAVVDNFAFLAGNELRSASRSFRGGQLAAFMGACKLDLREARPAPGGAEIDALAVWGGVEIRVPEGWRVVSRVVPLLGGFEDKTRPAPGESEGTLTVTGWAIMGGVEVAN